MVEKYEMYSVHKRDGRVVRFNIDAISKAVSKAIEAVRGTDRQPSIIYDEIVANTAKVVCGNAKDMVIDIEDIQNEVEKQLIQANLADVAKAYILYREQRNKARNVSSIVNKTITELVMVDAKDLDAKRENANINADTTMGSMLKIGSTITKEYNLDNMINPLYSQLHRDGAIHIHDLDFASLCFNCLQIPLGKLLNDGFATSHGYIRSPSTIGTAATLACIIVQADQNDCFN